MRWPVTTVPPEGLEYIPDFLSAEEEAGLIPHIEALEFKAVVMHGTPAKRTTVHFGYDYTYDNARIHETTPLPPFLIALRARMAAAAGIAAETLAEGLVSRYPPGAGIGWHRDARPFGEPVIGVSLASACDMRFRREWEGGREVFIQRLEPRSLYIMRGLARFQWQHHIASTPALRFSITFRTLRKASAL